MLRQLRGTPSLLTQRLLQRSKLVVGAPCFCPTSRFCGNVPEGDLARTDRSLYTEYWESDHAAPTLENMMLDDGAVEMDAIERPEILAELPSLGGKRVLELGAGIGRFSGILASKCESLVAVDFVESSCAENRRANAEKDNLEVLKADVTALELQADSFNLVFSNWLLMYLSDDEVKKFARDVLTWLQPGGHLFFRESCFHASGNVQRRYNPTQYRDPQMYSQMFSECVAEDGSRFQLVATNCVESYANMKDNVNQMWFRWVKLGPGSSERRMRLQMTGQYSTYNTLRYEKIYGRNYVLTGGEAMTQKLLETCKEYLTPGARVLDFGCGLGGTGLDIAEKHPDVYVHAVCGSAENLAIVTGRHVQRSTDIRRRLSFDFAPEQGVPEDELKYPPNSFDVVIVRETLMYLPMQDKSVLMQKIARMLRPGGKMVVVDYCSGDSSSDAWEAHVEKYMYTLMQPSEQEALLSHHFKVETHDMTADYVKYMQEGLEQIEEQFGPSAPARSIPLDADDVEKMRDPLEAFLKKQLPETWSVAAEEAAHTALDKVLLQATATKNDAVRCAADYKWAQEVWNLKKQVAEEGKLKWCLFVATRDDLNSGAGS